MTEAKFSTINNVIRTIQNEGFVVGNRFNTRIRDTFSFAVKHPKVIYILESSVKRLLGHFSVTKYRLVAILELPDDQTSIWYLVTSQHINPKINLLLSHLAVVCEIPIRSVETNCFPG
jgi:hypothetical protein